MSTCGSSREGKEKEREGRLGEEEVTVWKSSPAWKGGEGNEISRRPSGASRTRLRKTAAAKAMCRTGHWNRLEAKRGHWKMLEGKKVYWKTLEVSGGVWRERRATGGDQRSGLHRGKEGPLDVTGKTGASGGSSGGKERPLEETGNQ